MPKPQETAGHDSQLRAFFAYCVDDRALRLDVIPHCNNGYAIAYTKRGARAHASAGEDAGGTLQPDISPGRAMTSPHSCMC
jgi:hypothetical protein